MPASTHVKFFEYKPSGKDKKLQKTQTGCQSTFPVHLIRDVNQVSASTQNRSSPLNTTNNSSTSSSSSSNKSSKLIPLHQKSQQATPATQTKPFTPVYQVSHPSTVPPHACITTTTVQPTHYYAQTHPSLPHSYVKTIVHPISASIAPIPIQSQHYLVHYHPHHNIHTYSKSIEPSYPIRIAHGISKTHKMSPPLRQVRTIQPLCEIISDVPQYPEKLRPNNHIWEEGVPSLRHATPSYKRSYHEPITKTTMSVTGVEYRKNREEAILLSSSPPSCAQFSKSPTKITNHHEIRYPYSAPTNHLNVGSSQTLPSISDLFGPINSKIFKSAASLNQ